MKKNNGMKMIVAVLLLAVAAFLFMKYSLGMFGGDADSLEAAAAKAAKSGTTGATEAKKAPEGGMEANPNMFKKPGAE